ncbi:MAG TPA: nucleotide exchange factor GrpE [Pyrinomonadaceae bacterium]
MFRRSRKKMNSVDDENMEDFFEDGGQVKIPINDRRRFNEQGEKLMDDDPEKPAEPTRSARELDLENRLQAETDRREAAEAKLVGVQAKFDEARNNLEKETTQMRERLRKTLESSAKQAQFDFLTTLLPVLDNLNRAVAASEQDPSLDHLRDGVIGTARSFEQSLMSVGVETVPGIGSKFDPEIHEAVDMKPVEPEQDGLITAEYSKGYRLGDRLLRPARVQVGKAIAMSATE